MPTKSTQTAHQTLAGLTEQKNLRSGTPARNAGFFVGFGVGFSVFSRPVDNSVFFASGGVAPLATPVYRSRALDVYRSRALDFCPVFSDLSTSRLILRQNRAAEYVH